MELVQVHQEANKRGQEVALVRRSNHDVLVSRCSFVVKSCMSCLGVEPCAHECRHKLPEDDEREKAITSEPLIREVKVEQRKDDPEQDQEEEPCKCLTSLNNSIASAAIEKFAVGELGYQTRCIYHPKVLF